MWRVSAYKQALIAQRLNLIAVNDIWKGGINGKDTKLHYTYKNVSGKVVMDFVLTYDDFFAR